MALMVGLAIAGCSGDDEVFTEDDGRTSTSGGNGATTGTTGAGGDASTGAGNGATTGSTTGVGGSTGAGGNPASAPDPEMIGPYTTAELDDSITVPATGSIVDIHAVYPTGGPEAGPYPVVVFGRGFQISPSQYYSYLDHLASFGYVALTVNYPTSFFGVNHVENAQELAYGIDWALADDVVGMLSDPMTVGTTGHSLGGKLALQAAAMDTRIGAVITLDPVDGSMSCNPTNCPDVSDMMPLPIPTGFIGETIDATGGFQSCAPAADNFETFYAGTTSPSISVEVLGANHVSFVDNLQTCGLTCSFCNPATAAQEDVRLLSRAMMVAFFERHLRGDTRYDAFLTGTEATTRYVDSGLATIQSK